MPLRLHHFFHKKNFQLNTPQKWDFDPAVLGEKDLLVKLKTNKTGLTFKEAKRRLFLYGFNDFSKKEKYKTLRVIFTEFSNPLLLLLLIIATFSFFFGDKFSATIIYIMAIMSALLTFFQEHKAEKAVKELNSLVKISATAVREGKEEEVNTKELVPGDLVKLCAGDVISADMRLLSANDLFLSESSLTGESLPIEKNADEGSLKNNLVFTGSNVVSGTGLGVVFYTGQSTEFGKISQDLSARQEKTAFDKGIKEFTWMMIKSIFLMVIVILIANIFLKHNFFESLLFALAVAVGLAPETLPMIVTINLSKGALLMAKKKVIVKKLDSIQNFGAMDILCTDKTGTLTMDEVVLEKHTDIFGKESDEVFEYGYLNSFYQTGLKNLLDKAVLKHNKVHLHNLNKIDEIPFDFKRRIMSVVVGMNGKHTLISKGAPEEIFKKCAFYEDNGALKPATSEILAKASEEYIKLSMEGFRVLALAYRCFEPKKAYSVNDEASLVLKGFMAFLDPAKPDVKETINNLEAQGIAIKILTGDNEFVTKKICRDIGLGGSDVILGEEIEKVSENELKNLVQKTMIFARVLPSQKQKIIKSLQLLGHTVGFLGDGINDAPALKAADVGISVNNAAEIARDSASIILLKKSLTVLSDGVSEGRRVFGNIVKYLRMSSSSNFGNMLSVAGASLLLPFLPMLPVQILLNNFLYDVSQVGVPLDNVDEEYLQKPKPWNINLLKKFMVMVGPVSSIFDFLTFAVLWFIFNAAGNQALFHTGWFLESLLSQTLIVYIIRTNKLPFLQSRPSQALILTTLAIIFAGFAIPYTHLGSFFGFVKMPLNYYGIMFIMMLAYLLLTQAVKNWFVKKFE
jgi:P-type Mg2+ transporter